MLGNFKSSASPQSSISVDEGMMATYEMLSFEEQNVESETNPSCKLT